MSASKQNTEMGMHDEASDSSETRSAISTNSIRSSSSPINTDSNDDIYLTDKVQSNGLDASALLGPIRREQQKRRSKPKDKGCSYQCSVCGDRALGYNFDAITCESCKAFFRRNASKEKELSCSFEGNCAIDPHSRKFCPACRLKKCFDVGMKKEWILSEEQLTKRRMKAQVRKHGLPGMFGTSMPAAPYPPTNALTYRDRYDDGNSLTREHESLARPSMANSSLTTGLSSSAAALAAAGGIPPSDLLAMHHMFRRSTTSPPSVKEEHTVPRSNMQVESDSQNSEDSGQVIHTTSTHAASTQQAVDVKLASKASIPQGLKGCGSPVPEAGPPSQQQSYEAMRNMKPEKLNFDVDAISRRKLSVDEVAYIEDIIKSYNSVFDTPLTTEEAMPLGTEGSNTPTDTDIWNFTDVFIRRLIRWAKHFDDFLALEQHDQVVLLKGGILEELSLRSLVTFDPDKQSFSLSTVIGSIPLDIRKAQMPDEVRDQMLEHLQFVRDAMFVTDGDRHIAVLLMVIELFSPDRPKLENRADVLKAQERYCGLLRSWLESKYGFEETQTRFKDVLNLRVRLKERGRTGIQLLHKLNRGGLRPLLSEILGNPADSYHISDSHSTS